MIHFKIVEISSTNAYQLHTFKLKIVETDSDSVLGLKGSDHNNTKIALRLFYFRMTSVSICNSLSSCLEHVTAL